MTDVTAELLREIETAPGPIAKRLRRVVAPKKLDEFHTKVLHAMKEPRFDPTMGFISKPLLYSRFLSGPAKWHDAVVRLLKGGYIIVQRMNGTPPEFSWASREAPDAGRYYIFDYGFKLK